MTALLLAFALSTASARVESIGLTTMGPRTGLRVVISGQPGMLAVQRDGDAARVSIGGAGLGLGFTGGERFTWKPHGPDATALAQTPAHLQRLDVVATSSDVSLLMQLPPDASIDLRRDERGLLLFFRESPPEKSDAAPPREAARAAPRVAVAEPPVEPQRPEPAVPAGEKKPDQAVEQKAPSATPPAAATPPAEPPAAPPAPLMTGDDRPAVTPDLVRALFPGASSEEETGGETPSVAELYSRLWPNGTPETAAEANAPAPSASSDDTGRPLGPFRVRAGVDARYANADTVVGSSAQTTRDQYLEVAPRVDAEAPVGTGRFSLGYTPTLRAFATYDQINTSSQLVRAGIELPLSETIDLHLADRFVLDTLGTRYADPGGEYFFGLGRFHRNDVDGGASLALGPRASLDVSGAMGSVRFTESSSFFDYDTRSVSAGLGYELTPALRAAAYWDYDTIPRPDERPQAESRAHQGRLSLRGDILPLLTGEVAVAYRDQHNPNAGPGGTRYTGLTWSGALLRRLSPQATLGLTLSRSTPASSFENNGFYVSTALLGTLTAPLPLELLFDGGLGYRWNAYRTVADEIDAPRADHLLDWYVGLRRPIHRRLYMSALYRAEDRRSNVDAYDNNTSGFYLQLQWNPLGPSMR